MGKAGLDKGKRGEREVVKLLQPIVDRVYNELGIEPPVLKRNTLQSFAGGYDIIGIDWLALEVKFQERLQIDKWWQQTIQQTAQGQFPVLFFRQARKKWRVIIGISLIPDDCTLMHSRAEIPLETFLEFFEHKQKHVLIAAGQQPPAPL